MYGRRAFAVAGPAAWNCTLCSVKRKSRCRLLVTQALEMPQLLLAVLAFLLLQRTELFISPWLQR